MPVETFKIVALAAIFAVGLAGGLLSRVVSAGKHSDALFTLGNAFAGGVFLGAGIIHMLPDAREGFEALLGDVDYPWFALTCAIGFLFILFLERVCFPHTHGEDDIARKPVGKKMLYPLVLLLVLSIHSVITGIALGTEARIAQAAVILIAVLAHKGTAAFALGVSMLRTGMPRTRFVRTVVFFSGTTPAGIVLGIAVMALVTGRAAQAFEALFDALAAGTFLYVAVVDIIEEEFASRHNQWLKFALVTAGLGLMAVVAIWT